MVNEWIINGDINEDILLLVDGCWSLAMVIVRPRSVP
jgi:hypothetical protein